MKVLLIDHNPLVLKTIGDFLTDLGHEVHREDSNYHSSPDGNMGSPDLIIIDPASPRRQSLNIIRSVHELHPQADIVIMSDPEFTLDTPDAITQGVFSYLFKPVRLNELELLLTRVNEKRNRKN